MNLANPENFIPGLREKRAQEHHNRALAFSGLNRTVCGVETVPITPRHRLRLQLLRNAFLLPGLEALAGDVFVFLWILSPHADGSFPTVRQWALRRRVRRMDLVAARKEIALTLANALQDGPEDRTGSGGTDYSNSVHWMAIESGFWLNVHGGFTLESYLATPYLVLQQLNRAFRIYHAPVRYNRDGTTEIDEPQFIDDSDRIASAWQKSKSDEIAEIIKSRRERLPD